MVFRVINALIWLAMVAVACLIGLPQLQGQATAQHRIDLRDTLDATTVTNASARDMEMIAFTQNPGLDKWSHWKIKIKHPDTGAILSCYNNTLTERCRTFETFSEYLSFRVHEYNESDRHHFFHHSGHQGTLDGSRFSTGSDTVVPHYH